MTFLTFKLFYMHKNLHEALMERGNTKKHNRSPLNGGNVTKVLALSQVSNIWRIVLWGVVSFQILIRQRMELNFFRGRCKVSRGRSTRGLYYNPLCDPVKSDCIKVVALQPLCWIGICIGDGDVKRTGNWVTQDKSELTVRRVDVL